MAAPNPQLGQLPYSALFPGPPREELSWAGSSRGHVCVPMSVCVVCESVWIAWAIYGVSVCVGVV